MTTLEKQQELLSRMVTRLAADTTNTATSKQLASKTTEFLREVRKFNNAMSNAAETASPKK
jgi:hypothetical protein